MDKHIRKLDSDLARFEAEIQDKAISATRNIEEGSQKRKCSATYHCNTMVILCSATSMRILISGGRKKIKDKEVKNKSASSEEEKVIKPSKKKQLKKGFLITLF